MAIDQLERNINANPHQGIRAPQQYIYQDPQKVLQHNWFAFNPESVAGCMQVLDILLESLCTELELTCEDF